MSCDFGDEFEAMLAEQMRDPGFRFRWYLSTPKYWLILAGYRLRALLRPASAYWMTGPLVSLEESVEKGVKMDEQINPKDLDACGRKEAAEWMIIGGPDPYDVSHSCTAHLGCMVADNTSQILPIECDSVVTKGEFVSCCFLDSSKDVQQPAG